MMLIAVNSVRKGGTLKKSIPYTVREKATRARAYAKQSSTPSATMHVALA
jgi:hypothetical protein